MTLFLRILYCLPVLLFAGCSPRGGRSDVQERLLMHSSFEDLEACSKTHQDNLTTEKAHTGSVSMFVDAQHPFSATYRKELGALCDHRPRRLTLSAWVWVPTPDDDAVIVMALANPSDPDHPIFSKHIFMTPLGSFGKWKRIRQSFELPADIHANTQLILYLWHSNAQSTVYSDDWELTELW